MDNVVWNDFYVFVMAVTKEYSFGGDALLLAEFASPKLRDNVLDLCTGCGVVPVMMMAKGFMGKITAVDIQPGAAELCRMTAEKNRIEERFFPICADLNKLDMSAESFSLITVNPPYFVSGAGKKNGTDARDIARRESGCTLAQVTAVSSRLLKYGGRLCMCHRPERLAELMDKMREHKMEPKRLRLVCQRQGEEPWLVLVEGRRGGKTGLRIMPTLYVEEKGNLSEEMLSVYGCYKSR